MAAAADASAGAATAGAAGGADDGMGDDPAPMAGREAAAGSHRQRPGGSGYTLSWDLLYNLGNYELRLMENILTS